jgi:hypothetical protein
MSEGAWSTGGMIKDLGKKACPTATLSTTNPAWTGLGLNMGLPCSK